MNLYDVLEADAKRPRLTKAERRVVRAAAAELDRLRQEVLELRRKESSRTVLKAPDDFDPNDPNYDRKVQYTDWDFRG